MMKLYSDDEAVQEGYDPTVVASYGNIDYFCIFAAQFHHEINLNYPISIDERIHSLDARMEVPPMLKDMKFKSEVFPDRRIKPRFLDVMGLSPVTGEPPNRGGLLAGIQTIVSESARDKLAPYLKDECIFVPTCVEGAPEPYYILWVRTICDALIEEQSILRPVTHFPSKKSVFRGVFDMNKVNVNYLFRLPQ